MKADLEARALLHQRRQDDGRDRNVWRHAVGQRTRVLFGGRYRPNLNTLTAFDVAGDGRRSFAFSSRIRTAQ